VVENVNARSSPTNPTLSGGLDDQERRHRTARGLSRTLARPRPLPRLHARNERRWSVFVWHATRFVGAGAPMATEPRTGLIRRLGDRFRRRGETNMADIVKRSDYPMMTTEGWDPFRMMREMLRWDPFMREQLLREPMSMFRTERDAWTPMFEVRENGNSIKLVADLPGVKREDIEINLAGNTLTVSGKREAESRHNDEQIHTYERSFGQFIRSFTLPDYVDLDHLTSNLHDGVLTVVVPKSAQAKSRKIQIGSGTGKH